MISAATRPLQFDPVAHLPVSSVLAILGAIFEQTKAAYLASLV
jgi:hypothetical protein